MKRIFTVITPDGQERVLGAYVSENAASSAFTRKYPSDWRSLSSGPLEQREPNPGEKVKHGDKWVG